MLEMINIQFVNITHTQNNRYWAITFHSSQSCLNSNAVIWVFAFSFVLISYEFDFFSVHKSELQYHHHHLYLQLLRYNTTIYILHAGTVLRCEP